ncbi:MAG TPA: superoxide dismutase family protein [Pseudogracilibacillus sp.]|nr:superoxide dismutase family protein [Pseudogracilibacillus sp.]
MGRMHFLIISLIFVVLLAGCRFTKDVNTSETVELHNREGDNVGTATFSEDPKGVKVELDVKGLTPGFHGVHIHENGVCEPPDFESAGNHLNPEKKKHGLLHPKGHHLGDLPNMEADDEGEAKEELLIEKATLKTGKNSLKSRSGTSIIITSKQDDGMTQISGDSGERIICGVIEKPVHEKKEK